MKKIVFILGMLLSTVITAQAQTATPQVTQRQQQQAIRINEGVRSGDLNRVETAQLKKDQRELRRMKRNAKADGKVTQRERAQLQAKANQNSRKISRKKNN